MQSFKTSSMPISLSQHDLNTPTLLCGIVNTCIQLDQLSTTSPQSLNRISSQYTENSNNWVRKLRQLIVLLHANTYEKLQSEFSRESLKTIFARLPPLASAARCGPHPPHPLATPLVACLSVCLLDTRVSPTKTDEQIDSCGLGWAQRTT